MARRRYQLARCPECGSAGLSVTTEEPAASAGDDRPQTPWPVVAATCAHGCQVAPARVALPV